MTSTPSDNNQPSQNQWRHAPLHVFVPNTLYIVTAGTFKKQHFFGDEERLQFLCGRLHEITESYSWQLHAWAVFSNHYHFIAQAPGDASSLQRMVRRLHSDTAIWVNGKDRTKGRQVWFQYWDTCLTYENSYYARLNYVNHNPVKHGLAEEARQYPYCSAKWFIECATPAICDKAKSFGYEHVQMEDDF